MLRFICAVILQKKHRDYPQIINRQIGFYYLSKGNKEQAHSYLSRSFQLNPNQPEVAGELGRLGLRVKIPRKTDKRTRGLEKIVEQPAK